MTALELAAFLNQGESGEEVEAVTAWIAESRQFRDFVENNRTKIRKKLRTARTSEALRSVLLELEVARRFVADRGCTVAYERYGQGRVRSPDITVCIRDRHTVNLEVCRLQSPADNVGGWGGKLMGTVCHKLGQMVPEEANVLVVAAADDTLSRDKVELAMRSLKQQVERRDESLLRIGFKDPAGFYREFRWLSGILVWRGRKGAELWTNPEASRALSAAMISVLTTT